MQVRQLTGSYSGHIIDLRRDIAEACLSNGTVCEVGKEPNGIKLYPLEGQVEDVVVPKAASSEKSVADEEHQAVPRKRRSRR